VTKRLRLTLTLALLSVAACGPASAPVTKSPPVAPIAPAADCPATLDGAESFSRRGVEGTFVLRDEATGCTRATDAALADVGYLPASTFKIPNALIGLETGVITGESHLFRWDGQKRELADWNQDLDLGGALKVSCVPCFQQVARGIGAGRMRDWVHRFGYGNEDVSGPIDGFWLEGGKLRISPRQQVEFVHRSLAGELPVKPEHVALVWRLLEIERVGDSVFRGKTGLSVQDGRAVGWLVGYAERAGHRYAYATFVHDTAPDVARLKPMRKEIARELLVKAGALAEK
jgi:beta-lactamase class D